MVKLRKLISTLLLVSAIGLVGCSNSVTPAVENLTTKENEQSGKKKLNAKYDLNHKENTPLYFGNPSDADTDSKNYSDNFLINKESYTLSYNYGKLTQNWVAWHLDEDDIKHNNQKKLPFSVDASLPEDWYKVLDTDFQIDTYGFEKGQLCPFEDKGSSENKLKETYLTINMFPQTSANKNGPWKKLEEYERNLTKDGKELYIFAGTSGNGGKSNKGNFSVIKLKNDKTINVPSYIWKVILILDKGENDLQRVNENASIISVSIPNTHEIEQRDWKEFICTVDDIERDTNLNFFETIEESIQDKIEAKKVDVTSLKEYSDQKDIDKETLSDDKKKPTTEENKEQASETKKDKEQEESSKQEDNKKDAEKQEKLDVESNENNEETENEGAKSEIELNENTPLYFGNPSQAENNPTTHENNYLLEKNYYSMSYNNSKLGPNWVAWHLDKNDIGDVKRKNNFRKDNDLPSNWYKVTDKDYSKSGFDRGHLCPSGDRTRDEDMNKETFLMTNMMPQAPGNNQGVWQKLETYERDLVQKGNEVYIYAGQYGTGGVGKTRKTKKEPAKEVSLDYIVPKSQTNLKINVPEYTWKIIVILPEGTNDLSRIDENTKILSVMIPNKDEVRRHKWDQYIVSIDEIEEKTGYNFLDILDDNLENKLEEMKYQY